MRRHAIRITRLTVGCILLLFGIIGGFIPVLQGWLFVVLGLSVMAPESKRARDLLDWAKERLNRARSRAAGDGTGEGR